jgi:hydrocephalus-inducing protein
MHFQVHWNKDLSLKKELSFAGNSDILLSLIEPITDHSEHVVPIKLSGHAVFSHYAITPAKSLHFGPVTYNTLSKPRFFEVMNTGEFPFTLKVFPMPSKQELAAAAAAAAEKAAAEEAAAAAAKKGAGKAADKGEYSCCGTQHAPQGNYTLVRCVPQC